MTMQKFNAQKPDHMAAMFTTMDKLPQNSLDTIKQAATELNVPWMDLILWLASHADVLVLVVQDLLAGDFAKALADLLAAFRAENPAPVPKPNVP